MLVRRRLEDPIGSYDGIVGFVPWPKRQAYLKALHEALKVARHDGTNVIIDPDHLERLRSLTRSP